MENNKKFKIFGCGETIRSVMEFVEDNGVEGSSGDTTESVENYKIYTCEKEIEEKSIEKVLENLDIILILGDVKDEDSLKEMRAFSKIARKKSILTISMIWIPYSTVETEQVRYNKDLLSLANDFDTVIPLFSENMYNDGKELYSEEDAIEYNEDYMIYFMEALTDFFISNDSISLELKELELFLKNKGIAFMSVGECEGEDRINRVLKIALKAYKNYNAVSLTAAKKILLSIEIGDNDEFNEVNIVNEKIQSYFGEEVDILFIVIENKDKRNFLKIAIIGTEF